MKYKKNKEDDTYKITRLFKVALSRRQSFNFQKMTNFPPQNIQEKEEKKIEKINQIIQLKKFMGYIDFMVKSKNYLPNVARKIIKTYLRNKTGIPYENRKKIWLLLTDTIANMSRYKDYYKEIQNIFDKSLPKMNKIIKMDIRRTDSKNITENQKSQLERILKSLAKRNMEIGYCQGMNFISYYLLKMDFSEEETFWIMDYIINNLIPRDYYTNMIPLLADIKVLRYLLNERDPHFVRKLNDIGMDLNFMLTSPFLLIFTDINNLRLTTTIFDQFLVEGIILYFRLMFVVFQETKFFLDDKKCNSMNDYVVFFRDYLKNKSKVKDIQKKMGGIFLNTELIHFLRRHVINKEYRKFISQRRNKKITSRICKKNVPLCFEVMDDFFPKDNNFIMKTNNFLINLKPNYFNPFKIVRNIYENDENYLDFKFQKIEVLNYIDETLMLESIIESKIEEDNELLKNKNLSEFQTKRRSSVSIKKRTRIFSNEYNLEGVNILKNENIMLIVRKEHVCKLKKEEIHLLKKINFKKELFYKKTNDKMFRFLGPLIENLHIPYRRREAKRIELLAQERNRNVSKIYKRSHSQESKNKLYVSKLNKSEFLKELKKKKKLKKKLKRIDTNGFMILSDDTSEGEEITDLYIERIKSKYQISLVKKELIDEEMELKKKDTKSELYFDIRDLDEKSENLNKEEINLFLKNVEDKIIEENNFELIKNNSDIQMDKKEIINIKEKKQEKISVSNKNVKIK